MRLDNVRLLVTRFDECLSFYRDVLGLKLTWGELGGNYTSFDTGQGQGLCLYRKELMAGVVGTTNLPAHFESQDKFVCIFEVDDLEQTVRTIENNGGRCETDIQDQSDWRIRAVHLRHKRFIKEMYSAHVYEKSSRQTLQSKTSILRISELKTKTDNLHSLD